MLYREIMAVCSQIHTKLINTVCGQNVELWMLNPLVHKESAGLPKFKAVHNHFETVCTFHFNLIYIFLI